MLFGFKNLQNKVQGFLILYFWDWFTKHPLLEVSQVFIAKMVLCEGSGNSAAILISWTLQESFQMGKSWLELSTVFCSDHFTLTF